MVKQVVKLDKRTVLRCDHALNEIPTFVEFSFSLHQQNYTIKRNPKYYLEGKKTPKQPSALLILPDGKMVEGIKEVNQKNDFFIRGR